MKICLILLSFLSVFVLSAAELPGWLTVGKNGVFRIENLTFGILHYGSGFALSSQKSSGDCRRSVENGTVTVAGVLGKSEFRETVAPVGGNRAGYRAELVMAEPWPTLGLMLEFELPAASRTVVADGRPYPLPAEFDEKKTVPLSVKAKEFSVPLDSGSVLRISGNLELRIQDNRKFGRPVFSVRLYFTPSKGDLVRAELAAEFELTQPASRPVDLSGAATLGFADEVAGDGRGGWTDQGPENDLGMLRPGRLPVGGSAFEILDPAKNGGRSAVVLGRAFPKERSAGVEGAGGHLYLLHADGWPAGEELGEIEVLYRDGSKETVEVRHGRDVGNWWMPVHLANAVMVWDAENRSNYVGLYASQFKLRRDDPAKLTFRIRNPAAMWMIVGATLGEAPLMLAAEDRTTYVTEGKEWIRLDTPRDVIPGSPLDFSGMLDAPAGKYGPVTVSADGHFSFADAPEKRVKFVGINLCFSANFLSKESADALADRLARMGYNAVRFHHQDNQLAAKDSPDGTLLDPVELDKLEYLFAAMKKRGLYITTDVYVSRKLRDGENIPEMVPGNPFYQMKALLPISAAARRNWEKFARNWFTHRNPYTGMTWAEDPAFYLVSFTNENNIYTVWNKAPEIAKLYRDAFPEWMAERHPGEQPGPAEISNRRFHEFLYDCQHRSILEQAKFLRDELKVRALRTDLNMHNKVPLALVRADLDTVDDHKYHDHPSFPEKAWALPMLFRQRSAIGSFGDEVPLQLLAPRIFGKPFSITEYKFCPPNRYRSEGGPLIGGYAALQGWDALYHFAWTHTDVGVNRILPLGKFDIANEPLGQLSDRLTMFLFRRGDVSASKESYAYPVLRNLWDTDQPLEYPKEFSRLGLITRIGTVVGAAVPAGVTSLTLQQAEAEAPLPDAAVEKLRRAMIDRGLAVSSTGELRLNAPEKSLAIVTPRSECVTLAAGALAAGRLAVSGATAPQTVSASSLDGRPLGESSEILIFHLTDVLSQKMKFGDAGMRRVEGWGTLPFLLRRDPVEVSLKLDGGAPVAVEALKLDGAPAGPVAAARGEDGRVRFTADPGAFPGGVMVYRLTR